MQRQFLTLLFGSILGLALAACGDSSSTPQADSGPADMATGDMDTNEQEVITTVTLTFTPTGGGTPIVAAFDDPDGPGGTAPTTDDITLADGTTYTLAITFTNKLETPPEDITAEILGEADEHQLFITGTGVEGPATGTNAAKVCDHAYADMDSGGLPLGLANTITTTGTGTGTLVVTLQHLPEVGGQAQKTAGLAATVAQGGLGALPGDADATVTFNLTVN